ncbi:MAG: response regulator transcription factor [Anaerolineae bacterium]|nr:response regulator transcription factor [Anaerolineae bacterium]
MAKNRPSSLPEGTILIVEDDETFSYLTAKQLERQSFQVLRASNGEQGIAMARAHQPDLILLDILMPGIDGWETCRRIREFSEVPIMMLTCRSSELDIVRGLELGADDYMVKPVGRMELVARVRALLRRSRTSVNDNDVVKIDDRLIIDRLRGQLQVEGEEIDLSAIESKLLSCFLDHPNRILSHRTLLTQVWGWEYENETDYLKVYIHHLRKKIEPDPTRPYYILTERGLGYRFQMP